MNMCFIAGSEPNDRIAGFYRCRSIFITGVTGFLGIGLLEKFLRSCPDIERIYVLARPNKKMDAEARIQKKLEEPLFDKIREGNPSALSKVITVAGDMSLPGLGIAPDVLKEMMEDVSVVFHSACYVRFNLSLSETILTNTLGTKNILEVAERMQNLMAFIFISTLYANCDHEHLEEKVLPYFMSPEDVIAACSALPKDLMESICCKLLGKKPNKYVLSKQLSELLVEKSPIPKCIVRPGEVGPVYDEPLPGWVDNYNMPHGSFFLIAKGVYNMYFYNNTRSLDVLPLDMVVNAIVVAGWKLGISHTPKLCEVYHILNPLENLFNMRKWVRYTQKAVLEFPFNQVLKFPFLLNLPFGFLFYPVDFFFHWIPAKCVDLVMKISGQKSKHDIMKTYRMVKKVILAVKFFSSHDWTADSTNIKNLYAMLTPMEKAIYPFDYSAINFELYAGRVHYGMRRYLLKEKDENLPEARRRIRRLYVIHEAACYLSILLVLAAVAGIIMGVLLFFDEDI